MVTPDMSKSPVHNATVDTWVDLHLRIRCQKGALFHQLQRFAEDTLKLYGSSVACIGREGVKPNTGFRSRIVPTELPVKQMPFSPEDDGCVSCGAPVVPGTAGCKDCNEYAVDSVGAPRCLTEKQVFVMGYLAVRSHSFRTHECFINSEVMAAIHRDAERLWDMLQKGLNKG